MYCKDIIVCVIAFGSKATSSVFAPVMLSALSVVTQTTSLLSVSTPTTFGEHLCPVLSTGDQGTSLVPLLCFSL
jgi:hypothetical protein